MADKLTAGGELKFAGRADAFAAVIARDPQRYGFTQADAETISRAAADFRAKLQAVASKYTRSKQMLDQKDLARDTIKRIMEKYRRIIRANETISSADRIALFITERPTTLGKSKCPQTRPELIYAGPRHSKRVGRKVHVMKFRESFSRIGDAMFPKSRAKPAGAWGIAIYVELLDEHEKVPKHPGELSGGRPWLLQLATRGPIEAEFPVADRPMRVVYWARWVGKKGDMGPFSQTCVADFEGPQFAHKALVDQTIARRRGQTVVITTARKELPEPIEEIEALPGPAQRLLTEAHS